MATIDERRRNLLNFVLAQFTINDFERILEQDSDLIYDFGSYDEFTTQQQNTINAIDENTLFFLEQFRSSINNIDIMGKNELIPRSASGFFFIGTRMVIFNP